MKVQGIDFAMRGLAVFSDGSRADYPMYYRASQERLARCHEKVRDQRKDFLHKLSRKIADTYDVVAVEDLDMQAMSRGLRFGKSVMDDSNGAFREMVRYKLDDRGKEVVRIGRFYPSSRKCSWCGSMSQQ